MVLELGKCRPYQPRRLNTYVCVNLHFTGTRAGAAAITETSYSVASHPTRDVAFSPTARPVESVLVLRKPRCSTATAPGV